MDCGWLQLGSGWRLGSGWQRFNRGAAAGRALRLAL